MFDATQGRFLQRDPAGYDAGSADLYEYVGDRPAYWVDPSGQDTAQASEACKGAKKRRPKSANVSSGDYTHWDYVNSLGKEGKTGNDLIKKLSGQYDPKCDCLDTVVILAHGNAEGLSIGGRKEKVLNEKKKPTWNATDNYSTDMSRRRTSAP